MKKLLFSFVLLFLFVSCCNERPSIPPVNSGRFIIIYEQTSFDGGTQIIQDTLSGKRYLFHKCGFGAGLTSL